MYMLPTQVADEKMKQNSPVYGSYTQYKIKNNSLSQVPYIFDHMTSYICIRTDDLMAQSIEHGELC